MNYQYDVAISFAGENRDKAESIAEQLSANEVDTFYDTFEEADLWGKNLYQHLSEVYSEKARYCIILISKHYAEKNWTNHELKSAQERAFKDNQEYILPVRLDDTKLPGVFDTIGYLDLRHKDIEDVVNATLKKLGRQPQEEVPINSQKNITSAPQPRMPDVKKKYSDKDKEHFLYNSFSFIEKYLKKGLTKLEKEHTNIETSLRKNGDWEIIGKVYKEGKEKKAFRIWIGGMFSSNSICY